MSFQFSSIKFFDQFTGAGGGGTSYPNEGIMAKVDVEIEGYFYLAFKNKTLTFNAAEKSITNSNPLDFSSFEDDELTGEVGAGFAPGRLIKCEGTASNNTTFTIASISEDGRTIFTTVAPVDEVSIEGADIFDDTPITAIDLSYNLIENNEEENYISKTDKGAIQRFTVDGLDSDDSTPKNMLVSSNSFGWVTNELSDETTGETDEVTIEGIPPL